MDIKLKLRQISADEGACEALAVVLLNNILSDDIAPMKRARDMVEAYLDNDVDGMLIAICGWSMENLMRLAEIDGLGD